MNTSHAEGAFDEAKGKVKQAVGDTFNDQSMANSGAADEVKGHAEQTWGSVKDTASEIAGKEKAETEVKAEEHGHGLRESITSAAASVKESIQHGLDKLEHKQVQ